MCMWLQYRQGQEAKVRAIHPAGRLGDRCHVAGAGHKGNRRVGRQSADDGTHVAATVRTGVVPGRRSLRAQEHYVRDRHQAGVLALALDRGRRARRRLAKQPHVQAVHRRQWRTGSALIATVIGRSRPRGVPHTRARQDAHLHTHRKSPPPPPPLITVRF